MCVVFTRASITFKSAFFTFDFIQVLLHLSFLLDELLILIMKKKILHCDIYFLYIRICYCAVNSMSVGIGDGGVI